MACFLSQKLLYNSWAHNLEAHCTQLATSCKFLLSRTRKNKNIKMRSFIIITVLSALAACCCANLPTEEFSKGFTIVFDDSAPNGRIISPVDMKISWEGWTLLSQGRYIVPAIAGEVQSITKVFQPEADVRISGFSIAYNEYALPSYTPLPNNAMNITLTSIPGEGIHCFISIYSQ